MSDPGSSIEHRHLRAAIEFAVEVAKVGQRTRPPLAVPADLKPMMRQPRVPAGALGRLRRAIEAAPEFRAALGEAATPELVDEIGRLWLSAAEDWEERARNLVAESEQAATAREGANELRKERRRREAAENAAVRARAEVAALVAKNAELRAEAEITSARVSELKAEVDRLGQVVHEARTQARHEAHRSAANAARLAEALEALEVERSRVGEAESVRDHALGARARRAEEVRAVVDAHARVKDLEVHLAQLVATLHAEAEKSDAGAAADRGPQDRRVPLALPGGVVGDSDLAIEHLMRSGALIMVDGYNLTKGLWPERDLLEQREGLIAMAESAAQRTGAEILIVFDGADVVGAHAPRRRVVRVLYSTEGVTADDLIRLEVARTPVDRAVVVVTNDAEILRDVRAVGANTVGSLAFAQWCRI